MNEADHRDPAVPPREEMRLQQLLKIHPDARDLASRVASSSEATAELFTSPYKPESEQGEDPRPEYAGGTPGQPA
jgi:hypothetical protein